MPPLKPWTCIDQMRGSRLVALALLSAQALPVHTAFDWSDRSSSSSSSSDSSAEWDAFFTNNTWNNTVSQFGFGYLMDAAIPFSRKRVVTRLVTSKVLVMGARNDFARNDLVTTS